MRAFFGQGVKNVKTTVGVDFYQIRKGDHNIVIWDFAGQEWFRNIIIDFIKGSSLIIMVFDLSRPKTLMNLLEIWATHIEKHAGKETSVIVVGNKKDIKVLSEDFIQDILDKLRDKVNVRMFFQTSALLNENVSKLFEAIMDIFHLVELIAEK